MYFASSRFTVDRCNCSLKKNLFSAASTVNQAAIALS
jgi:hypothetical protein